MEKRIVSIQDYSSFGGSSGTIFISICSFFNIEPILIPSIIYSSHLGVKRKRIVQKTTSFVKNILESSLGSDVIHIGYFEKDTYKFVKKYMQNNQDKFIILDPILSDNGNLFVTKNKKDIANYKELIQYSSLITPNIYEACLLLNQTYSRTSFSVAKTIASLRNLGAKNILLKGVIEKDHISNYLYYNDKLTCFSYNQIKGNYQGCGDLICSIIACELTNNKTLEESVKFALDYCNEAIQNTSKEKKEYSINYSFGIDKIKNI